MIKVKVENLKKNFGSLEVLKDINMEVKEGEVVCLIGTFRLREKYIPALSE